MYGLVSDIVGDQLLPQPGYFAGTASNFGTLTEGLWDEHINSLYAATSPASAEYLKQRLLKKQDDLTKLGDLGFKGNVGRTLLGIVSPDTLLMSMAGGWVTRGVKLAEGVSASSRAASALAKAEAGAATLAAQAARGGSSKAVLAGVSFGAAENSAYEAIRQSVNFEDDSSAILANGLMGAAITAPFARAGAKASRRVAEVARKEHEVFSALRAVDEGTPLSVEQAKLIKETHEIHTAIRDMEAGRITPEALEARLDEFHGPVEPDSKWLDRYGERIRQDGKAMVDELFPNGQGVPAKPRTLSPEQKAQLDARVSREDAAWAAKGEAPQAPDEVPTRAPAVAQPEPVKTPLALAMEKARGERKASVMQKEQLRKAFDVDQAMAAKGDMEAAARTSERTTAFEKAEADRVASYAKEQERIFNARELERAAAENPFFVPPEKAPEAPPDHSASIGKGVTWAGPEGDTLEGVVRSYNDEIKKFIIDTDEGMKAVRPDQLDQHVPDHAPSGFLSSSVGAAQVAKIANIANQRTAMSKARLDYFAILNRSKHEGVRELAFKLVKDAIQVDKSEAQGWTASEHKKQLQRTIGGSFHREANNAFKDAVKAAQVPLLQRGQFKQDFFALVSKATRSGNTSGIDPVIAPHVQKAATAMKEAYAKALKEAQKAFVKGAQDVPPNDLYVNRQWHFDRLREAEVKHGRNAVVSVLANSIKDPRFTGNMAKAERFLKVVRGLEFNAGLQNIHLQGRDMGTLRSELSAHGLPSQDIDDLVDILFDARAASGSDAGQAGNLKFRFDLDETTSINTGAGELRLDDLFENDSRVLIDRYLNSMAGHIGLAKVGIPSQAAWAAHVKKIQDDAQGVPDMDGRQLGKELKHLEDMRAHITGRPMSTADFSNTARLAGALRGYTRGVMLGQLGLTAAFEMTRAAGLMGFKSMFSSMPSFRNFIVSLRQGYIPEQGLAEDVMHMTGFGQEMASGYERVHELESGMVDGMIGRIEAGANKISHVSDLISGNASFTSISRQMAAMAATKNAFEHASGKKVLTPEMARRWVGQGLDESEIPFVMKDLNDHAISKNGVLESIRYEDWQKSEPETYDKFVLFMSRQVRDAIQDQDIGETMPWMHSTLGKVFGELRTFMMVAHAKQFLKSVEYRDATALQMYVIAFMSECMAYSTQTALNFPSELDERLTPERIAKAAVSRMSINGLAPLAAESSYQLLSGGDSLFQEGSTSNTDNRNIWKTPSAIVSGRLINAVPTVLGAALGTDVTTKKEVQELWRAMPGSRLYGLPALGNYFADAFPKSDPEKSY